MRGRTDSTKIHHALGASKAEPGHRVPAYAQAIDLGAARKDPISRLHRRRDEWTEIVLRGALWMREATWAC